MTPDPSLTFATLVCTKGNREAASACLRATVARDEGPLLLRGGVSTGKTHLLHAVANAVARPRLLTCEEWRAEYVREPARGHSGDERLLERYAGAGALLVDDAHVLVGMPATQRALGDLAAALALRGCVAIVTCGERGPLPALLRTAAGAGRAFTALSVARPTPREVRAILARRRPGAPLAVLAAASRGARDVRSAEGAANAMLAREELA